jgi:hypothetical protein
LVAWQAAIRQHNSVRVLPQFACLASQIGWNDEIAVQLQFQAALADRPINTVYASRFAADCDNDRHNNGIPQAGARQLSVFLDEFPGYARMRQLAAISSLCRAGSGLIVCSDIPGETKLLAKLVKTDRE